MATMQALVLSPTTKTTSVQSIPRPSPQPGELLIRVEAVALNPVDALYTYHPIASTDRVLISDFAGVVVEVGPAPLSPPPPSSESHDGLGYGIKVGTRVSGLVQGANSVNHRPGAAAEYLVCPADLVWRVPDDMTLEEAAAVSLCALTAAQGLFFRMGLAAPFKWDVEGGPFYERNRKREVEGKDPLKVFIYGASTSLGMYTAQLVRRSCEAANRGLFLIGAASKARFPMLQATPYSYDALVDYRDADWPDQVRRLAPDGDGVDYVYDCISESDTVRRVSSTLREGGLVGIVRSREGGAWDAEGVNPDIIRYGAVWEGLGAEVRYTEIAFPASPEARAFAVAFYKWLSEGGKKLEANPIRLMPGGLERVVPDGFALLGSGMMEDRERGREEEWMRPISAEKLVYRVKG